MARDFDGTNDNVSFGSDAGIDNRNPKSICVWAIFDSISNEPVVCNKEGFAVWAFQVNNTGQLSFEEAWSPAGRWVSPSSSIGTATRYHLAVTYNNGSTSNDPLMWINGVAQSVSEASTPGGSAPSDAAVNLRLGTTVANANDLDGRLQNFVFDSTALTAELVNRARWWGRPKGDVLVYHPFYSTKLDNEGTATAPGTATGSAMGSLVVPVGRPGMGIALG